MKEILLFLASLICISSTEVNYWANHARFENFVEYYPKLIQETIYEIEQLGWSNLKVMDQTVSINEVIYDRHFQGQVNYTDGFLVSIQELGLTKVSQSFFQGIIDFTTTGSMVGLLSFKDAVIGYDVSADLGTLGVHRMTGIYKHGLIEFDVRIENNLNTGEITTRARLTTLAAGAGNIMTYLPETDIGEVLSRHYTPSSTWDAVASWGTNIIAPTMRKLIDKLGFPEVCFNC